MTYKAYPSGICAASTAVESTNRRLMRTTRGTLKKCGVPFFTETKTFISLILGWDKRISVSGSGFHFNNFNFMCL